MNTDAARPANGPAQSFPATCKRCGGQVSEPVTFCPHCGAYARLAFGPQTRAEAAEMPDGRTEPRADNLWRTPPAPLYPASDFDPYSDMRGSSLGARSSGARGRLVLFIGGFAVLLGAAVFAHHWFATGLGSLSDAARSALSNAPQSPATADGGASGADAAAGLTRSPAQPSPGGAAPAAPSAPSVASTQVAPAGAQPGVPAAVTSPSIASASNPPVATAAPQVPAPPVAQTAVAPVIAGTNGAGAAVPPSQPVSRSQPLQSSQPAVAATQEPEDQVMGTERRQRRAEIRAEVRAADRASARDAGGGVASARLLAGARDSLAKNDLSAARALLSRTGETRGEAAELRDDLRAREAARDAALGTARDCAAQQRWQCAWHNAGNALAIDASSREARALVRRSIVESGAATTPPGPGGGPDVPMLQP